MRVVAAVLCFLVVGCSGIKVKKQVQKQKDATNTPNTMPDGTTFSLKIKDQISNEKHKKEDLEMIQQKHTSGPQKEVGPIENYLDMWYVNLKSAKTSGDRRQCMDRQLEDMGLKSHIYPAISFKQCIGKKDEMVSCLTKSGYADCVKRGINPQAIATHGSAGNTDQERGYHIVSNACSHKRMMAEMLKRHKETNSTVKYAVLLEDDVAFDRKDFVRKVVNFAETYDGKYNSTWHMVQIDPFGSKCDRHIVGHFEGLPVWKPSNVNTNFECSNYWGAHALLVKYSALPKIIHHMENYATVPLDWLPAELDHGLAWQADIAKNPEAVNQYYGGEMHHQWVNYPSYCKSTVKKSTIGE